MSQPKLKDEFFFLEEAEKTLLSYTDQLNSQQADLSQDQTDSEIEWNNGIKTEVSTIIRPKPIKEESKEGPHQAKVNKVAVHPFVMAQDSFMPISELVNRPAVGTDMGRSTSPLPPPNFPQMSFNPPMNPLSQQYQFYYQQYQQLYQSVVHMHLLQQQQLEAKIQMLNQQYGSVFAQLSRPYYQSGTSPSFNESSSRSPSPVFRSGSPAPSPVPESPTLQHKISRKMSYDSSEDENGPIAPPGDDHLDLTPYVSMSQEEAARKLGIPSSTLSKRWRESTNNRKWPFRQINKIDREIKNLINGINSLDTISPSQQETLALLLKQRQEESHPVYIKKASRN